MTLQQAITNWNGKSAADIEAVYHSYQAQSSLLPQLIELLKTPALQDGASWLLKKHLECSGTLAQKQTDALLAMLPQFQQWQTCLHILQSFEYFTVATKNLQTTELFLRRCLADNNKFVRAWAYHGFYHLQRQYPQYSEEVKSFFAMAINDEAASVKARIRNIAKKNHFSF